MTSCRALIVIVAAGLASPYGRASRTMDPDRSMAVNADARVHSKSTTTGGGA